MKIELLPRYFPGDALEPLITARILDFHPGKHLAAYVEKLLAQFHETSLIEKPLDEVVRIAWKKKAIWRSSITQLQAWNHIFYWESPS